MQRLLINVIWVGCLTALSTVNVFADTAKIPIERFEKGGGSVPGGVIVATDSPHGLLLTPFLHDFPPGLHGFHIHEKPSCAKKGEAAGPHLDPNHTEMHLGPYDDKGHEGDLPVLFVSDDGTSTLPTLAPKLNLNDIRNHAFIIHEGGDNYSDIPAKLGGGGARIACGVIK